MKTNSLQNLSQTIKLKLETSFYKAVDDELYEINDGGEFGSINAEIYLSEAEMRSGHHGTHASFLKVKINIVDEQFVYKLYDKMDFFSYCERIYFLI